jgi:hypothetical protein
LLSLPLHPEFFHSLLKHLLINHSNCVGNSSQVSDGAGAVLLMKRSVALKKGLPILGVFRYLIRLSIYTSLVQIVFIIIVLTYFSSIHSYTKMFLDIIY